MAMRIIIRVLLIPIMGYTCFYATTVSARMVSHPRNVAATVGQTVIMSCTTDLSEPIAILRKEPESPVFERMYNSIGILAAKFRSRMSVVRTEEGGRHTYTLTIHDVSLEDAALYSFRDQGGQGDATTAELVVLDGSLKCEAPLLNDFIIPTDIESKPGPDIIEISCSLKYRGNFAPVLQLRHSGDGSVLPNFVAETVFNRETRYTLKTTVNASLNGTHYTCNVAMPESLNFLKLHEMEKWTSPKLRIHNLTALQVDHNGIGQTCPVNTTMDRNNCRSQHAYILIDKTAAVQKFKYICTTLCTVRDISCSVSAPPVESLRLEGPDVFDVSTFPKTEIGTPQTPIESAVGMHAMSAVIVIQTVIIVALSLFLYFARRKLRTTRCSQKTESSKSLMPPSSSDVSDNSSGSISPNKMNGETLSWPTERPLV